MVSLLHSAGIGRHYAADSTKVIATFTMIANKKLFWAILFNGSAIFS
jgi:hypothetical protein